jgi:hypothetical protein
MRTTPLAEEHRRAATLKPLPLFIAAWLLAGVGAVLGSILGNAAGRAGLVAGAMIGGLIGIGLTVAIGSKLDWLPSPDRRPGLLGGAVGFAIAAPMAASNLHTPITPVLCCGLAGVGLLLGVGVARGWRERS